MVMEATASIFSNNRGIPFMYYSSPGRRENLSPLLVRSMATQKPLPSVSRTVGTRKVSATQLTSLKLQKKFWNFAFSYYHNVG